MIINRISSKKLKEAITVSFLGDYKIKEFYDPNKEIKELNDIVEDISFKLSEYPEIVHYGVYEKGQLIGYFSHRKNLLISFSLNVNFRVRKYLRLFFSLIKKTIGSNMNCFLWSNNVRAIKYLQKNGMTALPFKNNIIQLVCL